MRKIRFIGDIHGELSMYNNLIYTAEFSIQCGDFGFGFVDVPEIPLNHRMIRGNHDDPAIAMSFPNIIKDGEFWEDENIFFLGGAMSTDRDYREQYELMTGKKVWWEAEELPVPILADIIEDYEQKKPRIVVTHDCPKEAAQYLHSHHYDDGSSTRSALDMMFKLHQPEMWIHGHHHIGVVTKIGNTTFHSLAEFQTLDLEV